MHTVQLLIGISGKLVDSAANIGITGKQLRLVSAKLQLKCCLQISPCEGDCHVFLQHSSRTGKVTRVRVLWESEEPLWRAQYYKK